MYDAEAPDAAGARLSGVGGVCVEVGVMELGGLLSGEQVHICGAFGPDVHLTARP